jgi:hypothetical protein
MNRTVAAAAAALSLMSLGLAACASGPEEPVGPPTRASSGVWSFDYDAGLGLAAATLRSPQGALLIEIQCQAPAGPIEFRDWTFGGMEAGAIPATFAFGPGRVDVTALSPATPAGRGGLSFSISPTAPVIMAAPFGARTAVETADAIHEWGPQAAENINAVASACAQRGS